MYDHSTHRSLQTLKLYTEDVNSLVFMNNVEQTSKNKSKISVLDHSGKMLQTSQVLVVSQ
jgi:hypothetical protein